MSVTVGEYRHRLVHSGLMDEEELQSFTERLNVPIADSVTLAQSLIAAQKLTVFQARMIHAGKTRGLVLGEYVVLEKLGQGGMGLVFKARHRTMDRLVALKVLTPAFADTPDKVKRFQREARAAARMHHLNVVAAFDAGYANGVHFLVMEFVRGKDLGQLIRERGALPPHNALECIIQAAQGLQYAHEQGVYHRDIKPANLLIDSRGTVKILDLGLARFENTGGTTAGLTRAGQLMGTVAFAAPEQMEDTHAANHLSDQYSLGCTLFYALTNQVPFERPTAIETILAHASDPVPSARNLRPAVPEGLDAMCQRMMAKKPADRFPSMTEVLNVMRPQLPNQQNVFAGTNPIDNGSVLTFSWLQQAAREDNRAYDPTSFADTITLESRPDEAALSEIVEKAEASENGRSSGSFQTSGAMMEDDRRSRRLKVGATIAGVLLIGAVAISFAVWHDMGATSILFELSEKGSERIELWVGGKRIALRDAEPTRVEHTWGPTTIKLKRDDYYPIEETLTLGYGETLRYTPNWKSLRPSPLPWPFSSEDADRVQEEWAGFLKQPARFVNSIDMEFSLIPPGEFVMGLPDDQYEEVIKHYAADKSAVAVKVDTERPAHRVTITRPFYIQTTEVTVDQFRKFVKSENYTTEAERSGGGYLPGSTVRNPSAVWNAPSAAPTGQHPVVYVSWNDALEYCSWLSRRDGRFYQLPTEAQWEYAARAGTTAMFYSGSDMKSLENYAWTNANGDGHSHPVREKIPNAFGLFDVLGNVTEWTADRFALREYDNTTDRDPGDHRMGDLRSIRGGSYEVNSLNQRVSRRFGSSPNSARNASGFRVIRTIN